MENQKPCSSKGIECSEGTGSDGEIGMSNAKQGAGPLRKPSGNIQSAAGHMRKIAIRFVNFVGAQRAAAARWTNHMKGWLIFVN